jgi:WD40 repeat protein
VRLIDTDRLIELPSEIVSPVRVTSVAFDPTGSMLAGGCEDHRVRLWDITSGEELLTLEGHSGAVSRVQFFPDGKTLATLAGRPNGTTEIFLWRATVDESDQAGTSPVQSGIATP